MSVSVLVIDDSALIRSLMTQIIKSDPRLTLVGCAPDAYIAKEMVNKYSPDVITLDIEMPKVDGLTFLDRLMKARPTPVVMISTLTEKGADATMLSLELGAIDFIAKPKINVAQKFMEFSHEVVNKILIASRATVKKRKKSMDLSSTTQITYRGTEIVVGIGASTGGTEAIKAVLSQLPAAFPAIVMTQHMPPGFTSSFAKRLNETSKMTVLEAKHDTRILPGHAYLAPGDIQMEIKRSGADYRIKLFDGERVSGHKPSVDVLFNSLAENVGENALGVILTGMGKDGASGLKKMREKSAITFAQDEASSVVFGMPKEAIKIGAVDKICDLEHIAAELSHTINQKGSGNRM